jgi:uncharacterized protein (DUF885 family)
MRQARLKLIGVLATATYLLSIPLQLQAADADSALADLFGRFAADWEALEVPELQLGYVENFAAIQDLDGIARQAAVVARYREELAGIERAALADQERKCRYDQLAFELDLAQERVALERRFRSRPDGGQVPAGGLAQAPDAGQWYRLYAKRWTSSDVTPEELRTFGAAEVERVTAAIKRLQARLGYGGDDDAFYAHLDDPQFVITDENDLTRRLEDLRSHVTSRLGDVFAVTDVPEVAIAPIADATRDTPPGYYEDGTFFYNFFAGRFRARTLSWLFIHEAVPGHHYQISLADRADAPAFNRLFWYPGFTEGWGAYAEDLGAAVGLYDDPYQELGKWEWDLGRSARVVLDVGLNYDGWTKEQALDYWHEHVPHQDDIAVREIDRIVRWPLQVASYKIGERAFRRLRAEQETRQGERFDLREFHDLMLRRGALPLPVLEETVLEKGRSTVSRASHLLIN